MGGLQGYPFTEGDIDDSSLLALPYLLAPTSPVPGQHYQWRAGHMGMLEYWNDGRMVFK
jgi:hypothetical protein